MQKVSVSASIDTRHFTHAPQKKEQMPQPPVAPAAPAPSMAMVVFVSSHDMAVQNQSIEELLLFIEGPKSTKVFP
jgi:hypothetical protein